MEVSFIYYLNMSYFSFIFSFLLILTFIFCLGFLFLVVYAGNGVLTAEKKNSILISTSGWFL